MYGDQSRIIFGDSGVLPYSSKLVVHNVMDADDRFYIDGQKWNYRKKEYLHYVLATPEKELLVQEYNNKLKKIDDFRVNVVKEIFYKEVINVQLANPQIN